MEVLTLFVFLIVFLISICLLHGKKKLLSNLPPGPRRYPFIGNFLQVANKDLRQVFREYHKTYGPIFSVTIFNKLLIVVNGHETLKDVFVKHSAIFSNRPDITQLGRPSVFKGSGIAFASGEIWKHNRRFVLRTLKDFGMGKRLMQAKIHEEISHVLDTIDKHNGTPFDIKNLLYMAVSNVMSSMVFGKRFDYADQEFLDYLHCIDEFVKTSTFFLPRWMRFIPGDPFRINRGDQMSAQLIAFHTARIKQHFESFDPNNIRDVIDAYIKEMKQEHASSVHSLKNEDELLRIVHELFLAGTETTTTVLRFGLIYLVRNPDVQTKVYTELRDVIPGDRPIEMNDKRHLPYTAATISEILRLSSIVPHSLPHTVNTETQYGGYTIPESALVLPNLESVAMDEASWDSPFCFNPSRFLDNNSSLIRTEEILPFSLGPRICVGEAMARMEIFVFLTTMIQRFDFVLPEGQEVPSYTGRYRSAVVNPGQFEVRAIKRTN